MKKLSHLFLIVLAFGAFGSIFQSCNNSKTYAEMLEDERKAVSKFIGKHKIKLISQEEFEKDTITNWAENEYVQFSNGTYLQIIDRGDGDTIASRNEIILRMKEYNIMAEINSDVYSDTISNVDNSLNLPSYISGDRFADSFVYNPSNDYSIFIYNEYNGFFPRYYYYAFSSNLKNVPNGIVNIMPYLKDGAHVKLIVPSKLGHDYALEHVYPYYYDIRKVQIK